MGVMNDAVKAAVAEGYDLNKLTAAMAKAIDGGWKPADLVTAKQVWEMLFAEYENSLKGKKIEKVGTFNRAGSIRATHSQEVVTAIQLGKPVPAHVLAEFERMHPSDARQFAGNISSLRGDSGAGAQDGNQEPFEHAGFKIYPAIIGGKSMLAVQSIDNLERQNRGVFFGLDLRHGYAATPRIGTTFSASLLVSNSSRSPNNRHASACSASSDCR